MASAFFNGAMCGMAMLLVEGRGRLGEAVQATRLRGTGPLDGMGALHITASKGRLEVCRYIIEELRLDVDDDDQEDFNKMVDGLTPLAIAMDAGELKCVNLLIKVGAVVSGDCILTAEKSGSTECFNYLMEETGANCNVSDNGEPVSKRKATEFKSLRNKAVEKKDYLCATGFYSKALDLYPDDATLFSNRSLCWHHMGDGCKALLDAYECRKLRSDWPKAYYRQGAALMLLKDYKSACEALYDGFKLDPGNSEIEDAFWYPFCLFWSHYGKLWSP